MGGVGSWNRYSRHAPVGHLRAWPIPNFTLAKGEAGRHQEFLGNGLTPILSENILNFLEATISLGHSHTPPTRTHYLRDYLKEKHKYTQRETHSSIGQLRLSVRRETRRPRGAAANLPPRSQPTVQEAARGGWKPSSRGCKPYARRPEPGPRGRKTGAAAQPPRRARPRPER